MKTASASSYGLGDATGEYDHLLSGAATKTGLDCAAQEDDMPLTRGNV
jgi:hypothetical protein